MKVLRDIWTDYQVLLEIRRTLRARGLEQLSYQGGVRWCRKEGYDHWVFAGLVQEHIDSWGAFWRPPEPPTFGWLLACATDTLIQHMREEADECPPLYCVSVKLELLPHPAPRDFAASAESIEREMEVPAEIYSEHAIVRGLWRMERLLSALGNELHTRDLGDLRIDQAKDRCAQLGIEVEECWPLVERTWTRWELTLPGRQGHEQTASRVVAQAASSLREDIVAFIWREIDSEFALLADE